MRTYGEIQEEPRTFLTLALGGGEWSASRPGSFPLGETDPSAH
jgi:hypothetical protein